MPERKVVIVGAAGRDFHNFNVAYRNDPTQRVVAFTATQIPDIDGRTYPPELAGPRYPQGIPIVDESELEQLIARHGVDDVVFSYSDVSHEQVMHIASRVLAAGADFRLLGPKSTELKSIKPLVAICAVRTGCGKSQTTRKVAQVLRDAGLKVVAIRHPMPYGNLAEQRVQRFAELADLDRHHCTIEEREEYEPHIVSGTPRGRGRRASRRRYDPESPAPRRLPPVPGPGGRGKVPACRVAVAFGHQHALDPRLADPQQLQAPPISGSAEWIRSAEIACDGAAAWLEQHKQSGQLHPRPTHGICRLGIMTPSDVMDD